MKTFIQRDSDLFHEKEKTFKLMRNVFRALTFMYGLNPYNYFAFPILYSF